MMAIDRTILRSLYRSSEATVIASFLNGPTPDFMYRSTLYDVENIKRQAISLVRDARSASKPAIDIAEFLKEYSLESSEGIILLSMAEALLRIPDAATANAFIKDRILSGNWRNHLGSSTSFMVNASSTALNLTNAVLTTKGLSRLGEPIIRSALRSGMKLLAKQFIIGETIESAIKNMDHRYQYSFDMLGESAKTLKDAERYLTAYQHAICALKTTKDAGISVKLSALYPRYEPLQPCVPVLIDILSDLAVLAKENEVSITIDAEESERLELSLDVAEAVLADPRLVGWDGLGMAVQAYQKRATAVIDWVAELGKATGHRIPVRLVKGAYWDTEIKNAQMLGLEYPVFTKKAATDVSWMVCAKKMLGHVSIKPAFATHNAHSLAYILATGCDYELQRLHGMGEALYDKVVGQHKVRVYGPVGTHEDLLAYLVRRMLENGANSSFVHNLVDTSISEDMIVADPLMQLEMPSRIPSPSNLYPDRENSVGTDLSDRNVLSEFISDVKESEDFKVPSYEYDTQMEQLVRAFPSWNGKHVDSRAKILERVANHIESDTAQFVYLLIKEAGKTVPDAISEVREAVDYCRWYASLARKHFVERVLDGPTGERNTWSLGGKGVFVCISPWNFPLAIFLGQVAAALVAGNTVAAKPAKQTPMIAAKVVYLLHEAGVPSSAVSLFAEQGTDGEVGARLVRDHRISGVAFTGGTETARHISRSLADRDGAIIPFIAETGGINAMIADSTALPEQLVTDVLTSAFGSAGQRCSSLRLLCLPTKTAPKIIAMLSGAASLLKIGNPLDLSTDVGPIIDEQAKTMLEQYASGMGEPLFQVSMEMEGNYFAPRAFLLKDVTDLKKEVFGPILHIVTYDDLDSILDKIGRTGFGLTLGIHSRNETTQKHIIEKLRVGNVYVNRNQIGAVVGVQPFGGRGLSGTGPKAGGPLSLFRYADESVVSINTTAAGGNASLYNQ